MPHSLRLVALFLFLPGWLLPAPVATETAAPPLRVLLAGLTHGHVAGFIRSVDPAVVELAGVWEPDDDAWEKYRTRPQLASVRRFTDLTEAMASTKPEAVWAFSDTRTHLAIVRGASPHGAAVIVEKPLAVSWADAAEMGALAARHGTLVLTNYETSWYPAFAEAKAALAPDGPVGRPRQLYFQDGHAGPVKIGSPPEFLAWLRDPARAGGGALFDFGCYGANLATWWLDNRAPDSVTAFLSRFDPAAYPDCDDHATIQLVYPDLQVTCVASWHWPYARKDAALYGENGAMVTTDAFQYTLRTGKASVAETRKAATPRRVPLRWFTTTIRAGRDPVEDPSSLANNLVVMKILEAARRSAAEHRTIPLAEITAENDR